MKTAIAAFATALVLATGASAMIGPYERAVEDPTMASDLFTEGEAGTVATDRSTSPEAEWNNGGAKNVTVFETLPASQDHNRDHYGVGGR